MCDDHAVVVEVVVVGRWGNFVTIAIKIILHVFSQYLPDVSICISEEEMQQLHMCPT